MVKRNEKGFTLIELMIVIAIIGILAAIAIPQFSAYRIRSYNAAAEADLRNAMTAQEAYFVDNETYCNSTPLLICPTYGLFLSDKVFFEINTADNYNYWMLTFHSAGNLTYYIKGPGGSPESSHNVWDGTY